MARLLLPWLKGKENQQVTGYNRRASLHAPPRFREFLFALSAPLRNPSNPDVDGRSASDRYTHFFGPTEPVRAPLGAEDFASACATRHSLCKLPALGATSQGCAASVTTQLACPSLRLEAERPERGESIANHCGPT